MVIENRGLAWTAFSNVILAVAFCFLVFTGAENFSSEGMAQTKPVLKCPPSCPKKPASLKAPSKKPAIASQPQKTTKAPPTKISKQKLLPAKRPGDKKPPSIAKKPPSKASKVVPSPPRLAKPRAQKPKIVIAKPRAIEGNSSEPPKTKRPAPRQPKLSPDKTMPTSNINPTAGARQLQSPTDENSKKPIRNVETPENLAATKIENTAGVDKAVSETSELEKKLLRRLRSSPEKVLASDEPLRVASAMARDLDVFNLSVVEQENVVALFLKNPSETSRRVITTRTIANRFDIPIGAAADAWKLSTGQEIDPSAIVNLVALMELTGDKSGLERLKTRQFWDSLGKDGVDAIAKDAIANALKLPETASEVEWMDAAELAKFVLGLQALGASPSKMQDTSFWAALDGSGGNTGNVNGAANNAKQTDSSSAGAKKSSSKEPPPEKALQDLDKQSEAGGETSKTDDQPPSGDKEKKGESPAGEANQPEGNDGGASASDSSGSGSQQPPGSTGNQSDEAAPQDGPGSTNNANSNGAENGTDTSGSGTQESPTEPEGQGNTLRDRLATLRIPDGAYKAGLADLEIATLAGDMQTVGADANIISSDAFWDKVKNKGANEALRDAAADALNLPPEAKEANLSAKDLLKLVGDLEAIGKEAEAIRNPSLWAKVREKGADDALEDEVITALDLPPNAKDSHLGAKGLIALVADLQALGQDTTQISSKTLWAAVKDKGKDQVLKNAIGQQFEVTNADIADPNITAKDLLDRVADRQKAEENAKNTATIQQPSSGGVASDANNQAAANVADAGLQGPASTARPGWGGTEGGAGASSSTGQGDQKAGGMGYGDQPLKDGSGSGIIVTTNADGSRTVTEYAYFSDGRSQALGQSTYNYSDQCGCWVNEFGRQYRSSNDSGDPPPDGAHETEYVAQGDGTFAWVVAPNNSGDAEGAENDKDTEDGDPANSGNRSNKKKEDDASAGTGNSDCAEGQDCPGNSNGANADSEPAEPKEDPEEELCPDCDNSGGRAGRIAEATQGRLGGDEVKNNQRALDIAAGGGYTDPPANSDATSGIMTPEELEAALKAIGIASGGGIDAPSKEPDQYIPTERDIRDALIRAGGGHTDPPKDGGGPSISPTPGSLSPLGPIPKSVQANRQDEGDEGGQPSGGQSTTGNGGATRGVLGGVLPGAGLPVSNSSIATRHLAIISVLENLSVSAGLSSR